MGTRSAAILTTCLVVLSLVPNHALATPPSEFQVDSIERLSPETVAPGDAVQLSYSTSGNAYAYYATFHYSNAADEDWDFLGTREWISYYQPAGLHQLEFVTIGWGASPYVEETYFRDGTVRHNSEDPSAPADEYHSIDFSESDFFVVNANEDLETPTLSSFSLPKRDGIVPGEDIRIDPVYTDDRAGVIAGWAVYLGPDNEERILQYPHDDAFRFVSIRVRRDWTGGTYRLMEIGLYDGAGKWARLRRDGSIEKHPGKAHGPDTHTFDFSQGDVTVDNSDPDIDPPELLSISQETVGPYFPGESPVFIYEAVDPSGLNGAIFRWELEDGSSVSQGDPEFTDADTDDQPDGVVELEFRPFDKPGPYELKYIGADDVAAWNYAQWLRNGNVTGESDEVIGTHDFDLSVADFEYLDWPHTFIDRSGDSHIDIDFDTGKFRVVVSGGNPSPVEVSTIESFPGGMYKASYEEDGRTLSGLFHPVSGAFAAIYEDADGKYYFASGGLSGSVIPNRLHF